MRTIFHSNGAAHFGVEKKNVQIQVYNKKT